MIVTYLLSLGHRLFASLEARTQNRLWPVGVALASAALVFFFTFPHYHVYLDELRLKSNTPEQGSPEPSTAYVVSRQIEAPFSPPPMFGGTVKHQNSTAFRLTMPLLGHVLGFTPFQLVLVENALGVALFALFALLIARVTDDKVCGALAAIALAFTYPGHCSLTDLAPLFDGVAFFCLLAAMFFRNRGAIAFFLLAAAWTDERALIASAFVFLWWNVQTAEEDRMTLAEILVPRGRSLTVVIVWLVYFGLRFYLQAVLGFRTPTGGIEDGLFRENWPHLFFGLLSGLEAFWLLIALALLGRVLTRDRWLLVVSIAGIALLCAVSVVVADMTRSISYLIPLIPLSLLLLRRHETTRNLRWILLLVLVLNMAMPSYIVWTDHFRSFPPLLPKALKCFWVFLVR